MHLPLVVPGEAQGFPAQLSECPLHDPPLRHDLESIGLLIALDDLKLPRSLLQALRCPLRPLPRAPADPQGEVEVVEVSSYLSTILPPDNGG
jgi:hypothetical protein